MINEIDEGKSRGRKSIRKDWKTMMGLKRLKLHAHSDALIVDPHILLSSTISHAFGTHDGGKAIN